MTDESLHAQGLSQRPLWRSMVRGAGGTCPACGKGPVFSNYLKITDTCDSCCEELHHHRADDAPPYFTIFIVGHIVVPLALIAERLWKPELFIHLLLWLPLVILLTLVLLPAVKGAVLGLQWALRMHGFEYAASSRQRTDDTT